MGKHPKAAKEKVVYRHYNTGERKSSIMAQEKIIVIRADDTLEVHDIARVDGNYLDDLQRLIGGYIEIVHAVWLAKPYVLICDNEGKLKDKPINRACSSLYGSCVHGFPMNGDIVLMKEGFYEGEPDIVGLTEQEASGLLSDLKLSYPYLKVRQPQEVRQ